MLLIVCATVSYKFKYIDDYEWCWLFESDCPRLRSKLSPATVALV